MATFRIVIVEDNHVDKMILDRILGKIYDKFDVHWLRSVNQITDYFSVLYSEPDLIFLDYYLPGSVEFEILRKIRGVHPNVPLILTSGTIDPLIAQHCIQAGADAYLPKLLIHEDSVARVIHRASSAAAHRKNLKGYRETIQRLRKELDLEALDEEPE